eukprot:1398855-Prymnesium_polylepis.1
MAGCGVAGASDAAGSWGAMGSVPEGGAASGGGAMIGREEEGVDRFRRAAAAARALPKQKNETLLLLYALFKQASAPAPLAPPPRIQMVARAKWEAWDAQRGLPAADAMARYCALVEMLQACEAG